MKAKCLLLLFSLLLASGVLLADTTPSSVLRVSSYSLRDTVRKAPTFKDPFWKKTIAPSVFLGLSAVSWQADTDVRSIRNRYIPNFQSKLDNYTQYAPGATAFALKLSGVKGRNTLVRSLFNWGGGMLIMGGLVNGIKYTARVRRPDGTTKNSFPSGHTATAFMNATFLHKEYGQVNPLYSVLGYSMSTYTGVSRSLNNRHWLSDILAGAGIGILSTELSYLIVNSIYKNKGDFFSPFDARVELENPSFLSIKAGQAFYIDEMKSFGKLGLDASLEGAYFFNSHWGVGGELGFLHMPFKSDDFDSLDWDGLAEEYLDPRLDVQSLGFTSLMVGGYYSHFLGSKFILQGKLITGIGGGVGGEINISTHTDMNGKEMNRKIPLLDYSVGNSWMIGSGVSFTMMVAPTLGLALYADYKYARPKAKITWSKYYEMQEVEALENFKLPISALTGGLKVAAFF